MLDSIKAVQAQQLYRVQPVSFNDGSGGRQQRNSEVNFFTNGAYNLNRPSVENSPTLGRSLDLLA